MKIIFLDDWKPSKVYNLGEIEGYFARHGVKSFGEIEADCAMSSAGVFEYITLPVYVEYNDGRGKRLVCFGANEYRGDKYDVGIHTRTMP